MSEFAQLNLELMLPELQQLKTSGLFSQIEVNMIIKKLQHFHYRLQRRQKLKDDYLKFAQYEIDLLSLVKKRRKRLGIKFAVTEIDNAIVHHIHKLFQTAIHKFKNDPKLYLTFIGFCRTQNNLAVVSRLFGLLLQNHVKRVKLWTLATNWEVYENKSFDNARFLFQKAVRYLPDAKQIWLNYFEMELLYINCLKNREDVLDIKVLGNDEATDELLAGNLAWIVFENASKIILDDTQFYVSFLDVSRKFSPPWNQADRIASHLQLKYPSDVFVITASAKSHFASADQLDDDKFVEIGNLEKRGFDIFKSSLDTDSKSTVVELFIDAIVERIDRETPKELSAARLSTLKNLLRTIDDLELSETTYVRVISCLVQNSEEQLALTVSKQSILKRPKSALLWKHRLALEMKAKSTDALDGLFQKAIKSVDGAGNDAGVIEIWKLMFSYFASQEEPELLQNFVIKAKLRPEVFAFLQEWYLELLFERMGENAWQMLPDVVGPPYSQACLDLLLKHSGSQEEFTFARKCFETCIIEEGSSNVQLWLSYIHAELTHPAGDPLRAGNLYWKALKTLRPDLSAEFSQEYALLQK